MKNRIAAIASIGFVASMTLCAGPTAAADEPLRLVGRTEIAGYEGDFDHFAADVKGNRLFLAGEDGGTVEVFDLKTGEHLKTVKGLETPHAIHYMAETNRLIVSDSGEGMTKIVDGKTYAIAGTIKLTPGADVMSYDPSTKRLWIVTGGKNASTKMSATVLSEVDPATGKRLGDVTFDTDFTEGIATEQKGKRIFVNIAGKSEIAVLDKKSRKVIATWPVKEGQNNAPIGLDEANKRLFVVTRKPFKLVVIDTDTGASVASYEAPQRTNELLFDKTRGRIYLAGDDYVAVFQQKDANNYSEIARVLSDKGAKTAILVPEVNRLYVAVAGKAPTKAALLQYDIVPTSGK
jgi:DNA-binding beta-propeller fold protein YncE